LSALVQARCEGVRPEAGDVKVIALRVEGADARFLDALRPGGHVAVRYPDGTGQLKQRLYTVIRVEEPSLFEIAVKHAGRNGVSDRLHSEVREGVIIPIASANVAVDAFSVVHYDEVAMFAGGIGVTLPLALIRELAIRGRAGERVPKVTLVFCAPRIASMSFLLELLELDLTTDWFTLRAFVTREEIRSSIYFRPGRPNVQSLEFLKLPDAVVICGSDAFVEGMRSQIAERFPASKLLFEIFTKAALPQAQIETLSAPRARLLFAETGRRLDVEPGKSILETLEHYGIPLRSGCRLGICGGCRIRIVAGACRFKADFSLSNADRANGYALACSAFPISGDVLIALGAHSRA
jgi:ferredoxin-NADP reductase